MVFGVGQESCGSFLSAEDYERQASPSGRLGSLEIYTTQYGSFVAWQDGYLSNFNYDSQKRRDVGRNTSWPDRMRWIDNWCRNNFLQNFSSAVSNLISGMDKNGQ